MKFFYFLASFCGFISRFLLPQKTYFIRYTLKRHFYTARYKSKFHYFGRGSLISKDTFISGKGTLSIGEGSSILAHSVIETCNKEANIEIGNGVSIGEYCHLTSANKIKIGNGVLTGRFVLISDNSHGFSKIDDLETAPLSRKIISKGPVIIEDNVWLGDKVTILPGVTVGKGSIIGANAVITKNVPPFALVGGNPAKVIKIMNQ